MDLSLTAKLVWAAGFVLNVALLFVLLYKSRFRLVPWFVIWIGFGLVYAAALFAAYRLGSALLYGTLYWAGAFVDLLLQIAVVFEIAQAVLRRSGRWVEGARARLLLVSAIAPVAALLLAWSITPAVKTRLQAWDARASLFTTVLICLLFSGVVTASRHLGLEWKSRVLRESYGLVVWTLTGFLTDTLAAYWRTVGHFALLNYIQIAVFQGVSIYWAVIFWIPEMGLTKVPDEAVARLKDVHNLLK